MTLTIKLGDGSEVQVTREGSEWTALRVTGDPDATESLPIAVHEDKPPTWNFWLPDEDRSAGWTNHCYVLQFVCAGYGNTPEEAAESAKRGDIADLGVPERFELPDVCIAIREDAEHPGVEIA